MSLAKFRKIFKGNDEVNYPPKQTQPKPEKPKDDSSNEQPAK